MTTRDKVRSILFWALMLFFALVLAKMKWAGQGTRFSTVLNYVPLMLVALLFFVVFTVDRTLKRKALKKEIPPGIGQ
jgi:hypothetical protein